MGTYRQPGIYVHKGYEQFNKAIAEGNKNFLSAYAAAEKSRTANKAANAKSLAASRKAYGKWGDLINKVQEKADMQFDVKAMELLDGFGEEYYEKVGSTKKEDIDRIKQLDSYPEQFMRIMASGEAIKKQYKDSYLIDKGKGSIDEDRTPSNNVAYAEDILNNSGNFLMPIEVMQNGKPTGNLAVSYDNKNIIDPLNFQVNANELYNQLVDKDSDFKFIYTRGDLKEFLNPYMARAKGEMTIDPNTGKKNKGNRWYANATKEQDMGDTYEVVDPSDPNYNADTPYRRTTTHSTSHTDAKNIEDLQAQLNTISMTNLMGGDDASWMFNEVINFARDNHPNDPMFQEGGADRSITTDRDNLFRVDANTGNLVSIPWISDQTVALSQYSSTGAYNDAQALQQEVFKKYAQEWMLDPKNGMIPPESSREEINYISKKQYDAFMTTPTPRGRSGRGLPPTVAAMVKYANKPEAVYTNPRYPNQELSPYQYDMQATQDALFKVTPGTGVNPPTLSNQRKTQPETMTAIVNILNDSNMAGQQYDKTKEQAPYYPEEFMSKNGLIAMIDKKIEKSKTALTNATTPADRATAKAEIERLEKFKTARASAGDNILYWINEKNEVKNQKINLTGALPKVEEDIQRLFHSWNGIYKAVKSQGSKMKSI